MDKEIAFKLAAALESGEYQQATLALRNGTGYCCLGVLCDIYAKETGQGSWELNMTAAGPSWSFDTKPGFRSAAVLPLPVMEWADVQTDNGSYVQDENGEYRYALSAMNDNGLSFRDIASVVRDNYQIL